MSGRTRTSLEENHVGPSSPSHHSSSPPRPSPPPPRMRSKARKLRKSFVRSLRASDGHTDALPSADASAGAAEEGHSSIASDDTGSVDGGSSSGHGSRMSADDEVDGGGDDASGSDRSSLTVGVGRRGDGGGAHGKGVAPGGEQGDGRDRTWKVVRKLGARSPPDSPSSPRSSRNSTTTAPLSSPRPFSPSSLPFSDPTDNVAVAEFLNQQANALVASALGIKQSELGRDKELASASASTSTSTSTSASAGASGSGGGGGGWRSRSGHRKTPSITFNGQDANSGDEGQGGGGGAMKVLSSLKRSESKDKDKEDTPQQRGRARGSSFGRARSLSPWGRLRKAGSVEALRKTDAESDAESDVDGGAGSKSARIRPKNNAFDEVTSDLDSSENGSDSDVDEDEEEEDLSSDDSLLLLNTDLNASSTPLELIDEPIDYNLDEEAPNVVVADEGPFPGSTMAQSSRVGSAGGVSTVGGDAPPAGSLAASPAGTAQRRGKKQTMGDGLTLHTERPVFERNRCTVTLIHGDYNKAVEESKRPRRYIVASDGSEESSYAVEWCIGTVLRDGDETLIVSVIETDTKLDVSDPSSEDKSQRLRNQKDRQAKALILARQATGLLQRTKLHVKIICQALHAKNARHMLLDMIDFLEPTMVIVGSRGLGALKGILLGSTSHYLVQKSSCPVMVARRRLKRPQKIRGRAEVVRAVRQSQTTLAQAGIEKVSASGDGETVEIDDSEDPELKMAKARKDKEEKETGKIDRAADVGEAGEKKAKAQEKGKDVEEEAKR